MQLPATRASAGSGRCPPFLTRPAPPFLPPPPRALRCAAAAVMSRPLAEACNELVTSCILGSDVVPHLRWGAPPASRLRRTPLPWRARRRPACTVLGRLCGGGALRPQPAASSTGRPRAHRSAVLAVPLCVWVPGLLPCQRKPAGQPPSAWPSWSTPAWPPSHTRACVPPIAPHPIPCHSVASVEALLLEASEASPVRRTVQDWSSKLAEALVGGSSWAAPAGWQGWWQGGASDPACCPAL